MARDEFQSLTSRFFLEYLPRTRGLSANTVASYRDSFVAFLRWVEDGDGIRADRFGFADLTADRAERFLNHLEEGGCSPSTCNNRLAALKAFCRFAQRECPAALEACAGVLAVKAKKAPEPAIGHLSVGGVKALLRSAAGHSLRDLALLSVMYDLGARVQEVCDLTVGDLHLEKPATALVTGKGGKTRIVPMTPQVAEIASRYVAREGLHHDDPLFPNRKGAKMTRSGVAYVLAKHAESASKASPGALPPKVTPHALRHSKAMHLLEAGVNLIYIRDFLGHSSVTTTEVYAKANPEAKRKAIEKAGSLVVEGSAYSDVEKKGLIAWLKNNI